MKPTLLILAAGLGSRYGGLKQLDRIGPHGETIMDYSVADAAVAGFGKVVFVIRRSMEEDFKKLILSKYENQVAVDWAFQELDTLPVGFEVNPERTKPWGTAHAILAAKDVINTPFAVINADDFYGKDAFLVLSQFLQNPTGFAMVGYQLGKTLSENGTVSRGVCSIDEHNHLLSIKEMTLIERYSDGIKNREESGYFTNLEEETTVSMNCWGFTPEIFSFLEVGFTEFLNNCSQDLKAEYTIPSVINHLLEKRLKQITVLKSSARWFGVTYQGDRALVAEKLKNLQ